MFVTVLGHFGGHWWTSYFAVKVEGLAGPKIYLIYIFRLFVLCLHVARGYRLSRRRVPIWSHVQAFPLFHKGLGLLAEDTWDEAPECAELQRVPLCPTIDKTPSPPASFATRSSLSERDWKGRFPGKFQSSKQDQQLRRLFTSQQLPCV